MDVESSIIKKAERQRTGLIFIGRTDAEAPILWPPDGKNQFIGKDSDVGED